MTQHKFIAITGIDGSGKDFVAQHLQQQDANSHLIGTPLAPFLSSRIEMDSLALEMPSVHFLFYLASVIHASALIEQMLETGNVYCVRYLLDTVVYHRAMGLPVELEYETSLYKIRHPDRTIFLTIDNEATRQERLATRGKFTHGDAIVNQDTLRQAILGEYARFANHYVSINNCSRDIQDVLKEIKSHI